MGRFADGLSDAVVAEFSTGLPAAFEVIGNAAILRQARDRQDLARIGSELNVNLWCLDKCSGPLKAARYDATLQKTPRTHGAPI